MTTGKNYETTENTENTEKDKKRVGENSSNLDGFSPTLFLSFSVFSVFSVVSPFPFQRPSLSPPTSAWVAWRISPVASSCTSAITRRWSKRIGRSGFGNGRLV